MLRKGPGEVGKSKDQRKPFGCAITRILFPSENKTLQQRRVSNYVDKEAGMANTTCRCEGVARSSFAINGRLLHNLRSQ